MRPQMMIKIKQVVKAIRCKKHRRRKWTVQSYLSGYAYVHPI